MHKFEKILFVLVLAFAALAHAQAPSKAWTQLATNATINYILDDAAGNVYVTGNFSETMHLGGLVVKFRDPNLSSARFFLAKLDPKGNGLWIRIDTGVEAAGDTLVDEGVALALDPNGNVYVLGSFETSSMTLGDTTLVNADITGTRDIFLASYTSSGALRWVNQFVGDNDDIPYALAAQGNSVVCGGEYASTFLGVGTFALNNSDTSENTTDMWFAALDTSGDVLNALRYGNSDGDDAIDAIAFDANTNLHFGGDIQSSNVQIGNWLIRNTANSDLPLTAEFDFVGDLLWHATVDSNANASPVSISVDSDGNTYVGGNFFSRTIQFGATTLQNVNQVDTPLNIYVVKYDPLGNALWAKGAGGVSDAYLLQLVTNQSGTLYATGGFYGAGLKLGTLTIPNPGGAGQDAAIVVKLDQNGGYLWNFIGYGIDSLLAGYSLSQNSHNSVDIAGIEEGSSIKFSLFDTTIAATGMLTSYLMSLSEASTSVAEPALSSSVVAIYPDPMTTSATLLLPNLDHPVVTLYDGLGREVRKYEDPRTSKLTIERNELASGVYYYRVISNGALPYCGKIVVE